jgi:hypothetical protein
MSQDKPSTIGRLGTMPFNPFDMEDENGRARVNLSDDDRPNITLRIHYRQDIRLSPKDVKLMYDQLVVLGLIQ